MSSDESSDEEYKPQEEESDVSKNSETDNDSDEYQLNAEECQIKRKRKTQKGTNQKRKTLNSESKKDLHSIKEKEEDEKDKTNALWASFLNDTNELATVVDNTTKTTENIVETHSDKTQIKLKLSKSNPGLGAKPKFNISRPCTSGLANALNQLEKKSKISTLELSKLDWMNYKKDEGIEEELQTHNRGKNGFLERQDFLQRTDLRQFEREREIRQSKRSNQ